ncbi:MAG: radical SAM protein, partial [Methanomicrobiales archaeon]|nr:radical SAM protein [Methanomicrobiales archaeon]
FSFAHLPVQSGSDAVLAAMQRGYRAEDFETIVDAFRKRLADIRISTDCIVGFPGETDADAAATIELLARTRPTKVNITRYSARPGTRAALLYDMPDWIKKERSRALTRAANALCDAENERMAGRELDVIVTERQRPGTCIARDAAYRNIVIARDLPPGTLLRVAVTGHKRHYLTGMPVTHCRAPAR